MRPLQSKSQASIESVVIESVRDSEKKEGDSCVFRGWCATDKGSPATRLPT